MMLTSHFLSEIARRRDDFLNWVYGLVCTHYEAVIKDHPLRRYGGFPPNLTVAEVLTLEIGVEYFQPRTDKARFRYFRSHYPHGFPNLTDRTLLVRQAANLWQISELSQPRIVAGGGQRTANWQVFDTLPVASCRITRAKPRSCRSFVAGYGYGAATREDYYGLKLGLRFTPLGMRVHYPRLQARPQDVGFLEDLVGEFRGDIIADKGFLDQRRRQVLQGQSVFIRTPPRRNLKTSNG